mgnify:CR=1 FL=1
MRITELFFACSEDEHSRNTAFLAFALAEKIGHISAGICEPSKVFSAGLYHDIGKFLIDERLFRKGGNLSEREKRSIRKHTAYGARIVKRQGFDENVVSAILHHHENWDGTGYPAGLNGYEIPLSARILRICDAYDALVSERPYRDRAYTKDEALCLLEKDSGIDEALFEVFVGVVEIRGNQSVLEQNCEKKTID